MYMCMCVCCNCVGMSALCDMQRVVYNFVFTDCHLPHATCCMPHAACHIPIGIHSPELFCLCKGETNFVFIPSINFVLLPLAACRCCCCCRRRRRCRCRCLMLLLLLLTKIKVKKWNKNFTKRCYVAVVMLPYAHAWLCVYALVVPS